MAEIVPGYTTEQTVLIVEANENSINDTIEDMAVSSWIVVSLTLTSTDESVIILFTRTTLSI